MELGRDSDTGGQVVVMHMHNQIISLFPAADNWFRESLILIRCHSVSNS